LRLQPQNAKPAERGVPFIVPQLCFAFDDDITLPLAGVPTDMDATDLTLSMERRLFLKLEGQYMAEGSLRQYLLKSVQDLLQRRDMNLPLLLRCRVALEKKAGRPLARCPQQGVHRSVSATAIHR